MQDWGSIINKARFVNDTVIIAEIQEEQQYMANGLLDTAGSMKWKPTSTNYKLWA